MGGGVWGSGLSTEEITWQIAMAAKYGNGVQMPKHEIKARDVARKVEEQARQKATAEATAKAGTPSE